MIFLPYISLGYFVIFVSVIVVSIIFGERWTLTLCFMFE